jgi:hypothetical protein
MLRSKIRLVVPAQARRKEIQRLMGLRVQGVRQLRHAGREDHDHRAQAPPVRATAGFKLVDIVALTVGARSMCQTASMAPGEQRVNGALPYGRRRLPGIELDNTFGNLDLGIRS